MQVINAPAAALHDLVSVAKSLAEFGADAALAELAGKKDELEKMAEDLTQREAALASTQRDLEVGLGEQQRLTKEAGAEIERSKAERRATDEFARKASTDLDKRASELDAKETDLRSREDSLESRAASVTAEIARQRGDRERIIAKEADLDRRLKLVAAAGVPGG